MVWLFPRKPPFSNHCALHLFLNLIGTTALAAAVRLVIAMQRRKCPTWNMRRGLRRKLESFAPDLAHESLQTTLAAISIKKQLDDMHFDRLPGVDAWSLTGLRALSTQAWESQLHLLSAHADREPCLEPNAGRSLPSSLSMVFRGVPIPKGDDGVQNPPDQTERCVQPIGENLFQCTMWGNRALV